MIFRDCQKLLTKSRIVGIWLDGVRFPVYVVKIEVTQNPSVSTNWNPRQVGIYLVDVLWIIYVWWSVKGSHEELASLRNLDLCPNKFTLTVNLQFPWFLANQFVRHQNKHTSARLIGAVFTVDLESFGKNLS